MTYLRRLADTAMRFAMELGGGKLTPADRALSDEVLRRLDIVAGALAGTARPEALAAIRPQPTAAAGDAPLASWLERLAADTALLAAATRKLLRRGAQAKQAAVDRGGAGV